MTLVIGKEEYSGLHFIIIIISISHLLIIIAQIIISKLLIISLNLTIGIILVQQQIIIMGNMQDIYMITIDKNNGVMLDQ